MTNESDDQLPRGQDLLRNGFRVERDYGPWTVTYTWDKDADQGNPMMVTVRPGRNATDDDLAGGIPATLMRQLNFSDVVDEWRKKRERRTDLSAKQKSATTQRLRTLLSDQGVSDEYLANLADAYVRLVMNGDRSVTKSLAGMIDRSPETVKLHLKQARAKDLLTTVRGRAGGHLTDAARVLLGGPTGRRPL